MPVSEQLIEQLLADLIAAGWANTRNSAATKLAAHLTPVRPGENHMVHPYWEQH